MVVGDTVCFTCLGNVKTRDHTNNAVLDMKIKAQ